MNDSRITSFCQPEIKTTHTDARSIGLNPSPALFAARKSLGNGAFEPIGREMRINLRGGQACMPQQLLDRAQVRSALEQIGRKSMAHRMRGDIGRDTRKRRQHMKPSPKHGGAHTVAACRDKQRMHTVRTVATLCVSKKLRSSFLNIAAGRIESTPIQGHDTLLAPLTPKPQRSLGPSNGLNIECRKLGDASPRCIEQFEHRRIAQSRRR